MPARPERDFSQIFLRKIAPTIPNRPGTRKLRRFSQIRVLAQKAADLYDVGFPFDLG